MARNVFKTEIIVFETKILLSLEITLESESTLHPY